MSCCGTAGGEISQRSPKAKAVLLTRHDDDQYVLAALRAGARGYVLKSQAATDLGHAIKQVFRGDLYLSPGVSKVVVEAFLSEAGRQARSFVAQSDERID